MWLCRDCITKARPLLDPQEYWNDGPQVRPCEACGKTVECVSPAPEPRRYFSADESEDRRAVGRTLAVLSDIEEIDGETTTGEAFRKYVRKYIVELRAKLPNYEGKT